MKNVILIVRFWITIQKLILRNYKVLRNICHIHNMSLKDQIDSARRIIDTETTKILSDSSLIGYGGCASCHVLFKLIETLSLNESDAADLLSEILYEDPQLNERITEFMFDNNSKLI